MFSFFLILFCGEEEEEEWEVTENDLTVDDDDEVECDLLIGFDWLLFVTDLDEDCDEFNLLIPEEYWFLFGVVDFLF